MRSPLTRLAAFFPLLTFRLHKQNLQFSYAVVLRVYFLDSDHRPHGRNKLAALRLLICLLFVLEIAQGLGLLGGSVVC